MMKVKINHITNLADARACSGWHVDFLSFDVGRDHDFKVSIQMVNDICEWVSGPGIILDFGMDIAGANYFLENNQSSVLKDIYIGLHEEFLPFPNLFVTINNDIGNLDNWAANAAFIEIKQLPIATSIPNNCFINLDTIPFADSLKLNPLGISLGESVQENPLNLDYDKIETIFDTINFHSL